jgi:hypothetical protein
MANMKNDNDNDNKNTLSTGNYGKLYEIRVKGHLDDSWSDWLGGLEVKLFDNGEMILSGHIGDQAALLGALNKLNRLNLTILSVNEIEKEN